MKKHLASPIRFASPLAAAFALLLFIGLVGFGCEAADDFNSRIACDHYCAKNFACQDKSPSSDETRNCIDHCRDSIENQCGNDNQGAANDKIEDCVDKSCTEFWACMAFDAAPECFGFVTK